MHRIALDSVYYLCCKHGVTLILYLIQFKQKIRFDTLNNFLGFNMIITKKKRKIASPLSIKGKRKVGLEAFVKSCTMEIHFKKIKTYAEP